MATKCNNEGSYPKLTGKKRKAAEMLTNPDFDGNISKLCNEELKIARSTFYRWFDDMDFVGYVEYLIEKYTDSELANVWKALTNKAKSGSTDAIKLYFELRGKYKKNTSVQNQNMQTLADLIFNPQPNRNISDFEGKDDE